MAKSALKLKPPPAIDWDRVGKLFEAGATLDGVLAMIGVTQDDLFTGCQEDNGVDLLAFAQQRRAKGEELIRIKQFQLAMQGDKSMLRQISKTRTNAPGLKVVSDPSGELISIREIAKRCDIDRATCSKRLTALGYVPEAVEAKLKLYRFDTAMETALISKSDAYSDAKLRDLTAAADLKELKLREAMGDLVPMKDAVEIAQQLVGAIYQEYTVRAPKRIATKLAKAKNVTDVKKILKADSDRIMKQLRENFERFIGQK